MRTARSIIVALFAAAFTLALAACGGSPSATPTPTPALSASASPTASPSLAPTPTATIVATPSVAPTATASAVPTATSTTAPTGGPTPTIPTGPASLDGPAEVEADAQFEVAWTGPNAPGDYITIVPVGTVAWSSQDYFYTIDGSPGQLLAPTTDGDYELWYVSGTDGTIAAREPITVTPFVGSLDGPEEVEAGTEFEVSWTGPSGPGDYITIVLVGTDTWSGESYFYTANGSPGTLISRLEDGDYELWYVAGQDVRTMISRPITVTP